MTRAAMGASGALRAGYQEAAALGPWTVELLTWQPRRYRLRAPVQRRDEHWSAYRPLGLVLVAGRDVWIWDDVTPTWSPDGTVQCIVGGAPAIHRGGA